MSDSAFRDFPDVKVLDPVVAQLFRASSCSLSPETANFRLCRTIPITIFIDGNYEHFDTVADDLTNGAVEILNEKGYKLVGQWGPHKGSRLITLFGQGKKPETGSTLLLETFPELCEKFRDLSERVPEAARNAIQVAIIVGPYAIHVLGFVGALPATIPFIVLEAVALCFFDGPHVIEQVRHVLGLREDRPKFDDLGF